MAQRSPRHLSLISSGSRSRESPSRNGSQPSSRRQRRQRRKASSSPFRLFNGLMRPFGRKSSRSQNSPTPFSGNGSPPRTAESLEPLVSELRQRQHTRLRQPQPPKTPTRRRSRTQRSTPLPPIPVDPRQTPNFASSPPVRQSRPTPQPPTSPGVSRPKRVPRKPRRRFSPMIYLVRLLILGVGIAVLSGTVLWVLSSLGSLGESTAATSSESITVETATESRQNPGSIEGFPLAVQLSQRLRGLQQKIEALTPENSGLRPGVLLVDLDTGGFVDIESEEPFPAASTIKVPILVAYLLNRLQYADLPSSRLHSG